MLTEQQQRQVARLIDKAANLTGIAPEEIIGKCRKRDRVYVRNAISFAMRENGWKLHEIGRATGGRDHSTVIHSIRGHERAMFVAKRDNASAEFEAVELAHVLKNYMASDTSLTSISPLGKLLIAKEMHAKGSSVLAVVGIVA